MANEKPDRIRYTPSSEEERTLTEALAATGLPQNLFLKKLMTYVPACAADIIKERQEAQNDFLSKYHVAAEEKSNYNHPPKTKPPTKK